jgi:glycerol-3-phosphate acyltransferase PlsX
LISVSVDAMGGDHAPGEIVAGAVRFLRDGGSDAEGVRLLLVGDPGAIRAALADHGASEDDRLVIVPASEVVAMDEHPMEAVRRKPGSSLCVSARLVGDGTASATVSAGNTGACMVAAIQLIGRIPGVSRPAIGTAVPVMGGTTLVVDAGANVDCRSSHLVQFAVLGSLYAQAVMGIPEPKVGILSNGEEAAKGNELVKETRPLLEQSNLRFVGSIEANHLMEGEADVVTCDGFVGNVFLKSIEGMARLALSVVGDCARAAPENAGIADAARALFKRVDYSEYGGAPLLGIRGVSIIAHGRSKAPAMRNAIRVAAQAAKADYVSRVEAAFAGQKDSA